MQIKSSKKIPLLELLLILSPDSSKNTLRSWIEKGRVTIDGKGAIGANQVIEKGQEVVVGTKQKFLPQGLKIIYEDNHLVVVDKPAGLLSVATELETFHTVHAFLKHRFHARSVYPIHRLDRETSGLLVFAYSQKAREALKEQLEQRSMRRHYLALVHGYPGKGTWRCHLIEDKSYFVHVSDKGKLAITHFETLEKRGAFSLLKLKLETGRKHQIRVQASHAGYPIVGDDKYGKKEETRLHLHAKSLSFKHPILQKQMTFSSEASFSL